MAFGSLSDGVPRRARLIAVFVGLPLLLGGILATIKDNNQRARQERFQSLHVEATETVDRLGDYFHRSRDVLLLAAQNPAFRDYFSLAGDRETRIRNAGKVIDDLNETVQYIHSLYADSVQEVCYIDLGGAEIARQVNEGQATFDQLSLDERSNSFFGPTVNLQPGQVLQAAHYRSPDTHTWVISNSTPVTDRQGDVAGIFHFEVSIESFRRSIAVRDDGTVTRVWDGRTGAVLMDSRYVQEGNAAVGRPEDLTFAKFVGSAERSRSFSNEGQQVSFVRVKHDDANQNDWVVAVSAPATSASLLSGVSVTSVLTLIASALLLCTAFLSARAYRRRLEVAAVTDPLTGLPNRVLFHDRAQQALALNARAGARMGLLLLDLDRFKEINDSLGHHAGDELLRAIGPRLQSVLRRSDTLARLGGDEFGIVLPTITSPTAANLIAERILYVLREPFIIQGLEVAIEASIGVVVGPHDGEDVDVLLQHADISMYAAKQGRLGSVAYDASLDVYKPENLSQFAELRRAIDNGDLVLHYQPKIELDDGRITGVEALVRWLKQDGTLVPPLEFIPLAERTALITPLTMHVLHTALAQCRKWLDDGREISVAVNISTRSLLDRAFPAVIAAVLTTHAVPPHLLELELTESTLITDPTCAREVLDALHNLGVRLSIDDFGTGYSSLAYLKDLPIDTLKIDRSFVASLRSEDGDAIIVRSMIDLGKRLGLRIIAEGVEDAETAALLAETGCDAGQGYYWNRPVSAADLEAALAASVSGVLGS